MYWKFKQISCDTPALVYMKIDNSFPMENGPHFVYMCLTQADCSMYNHTVAGWCNSSMCAAENKWLLLKGSVTVSGDWLLCIPVGHTETSFRAKHLTVPGNENDSTSVLRSVLFQNFTQHGMVVLYWRFGTVYWSHLQGSRIFDCWTFDDGTNR